MASSHSSQSVVTETVVAFLRNVPPFQFLAAPELTRLTNRMTLEFFPKNTLILSAGQRASDALYVVYKGESSWRCARKWGKS